jgi:DNA polymerase-1
VPSETMIIIDGNSLLHRAFHAIPPLSTSSGLATNAVFGFTNMLLKVLAEGKPDFIAVAFDKGKITFRHSEYKAYKGTRKPTPEELRPQFPLVKEVLQAMRIQIFELDNFEADDLIGTLSAQAEQTGIESIILTGDRDALQLISPLTRVKLTRKGISELEDYDAGKVWDRFGITPLQYTDFRGLTGDSSDNVPGVPGIGEKTAARLLKEYGSMEALLAAADEITGRVGTQLRAHKEQALMSKQLVTIHRTAPIAIDLEQCRWQGPDYKELLDVFKKLEFNSLIKSIFWNNGEKSKDGASRATIAAQQAFPEPDLETCLVDFKRLATAADLKSLIKAAQKSGTIALAIESDDQRQISAAGFALKGGNVYRLAVADKTLSSDLNAGNDAGSFAAIAMQTLKTICEDPTIKKYCHNGKEAIWLLHHSGISLNHLAFDSMLAAYLLNPAVPNRALEDVSLEHLEEVLPKGEENLPARAQSILQLAEVLDEKLKLQEQDRLFYEVEMPLVEILAAMEIEGIKVDKEYLEEMSRNLGASIELLTKDIYELAGQEFNINSPKQLGKVLFEDLKLPVLKKTKTGYSTDAGVLEKLAMSHDVVAKILEYRQLIKLKSTYTDGLAALLNPATGHLHTTFHQTVTATGRLSSAEPNLQNIPIRMEAGRLIRKAFTASKPENLLLTADYSQIELRILAHLSGDPVLIDAFRKGEDIHTRTASEVFGVPPEEVTAEMRSRAKAVNFGIIYGLSDFGLSRDINVSRQEAKQYIDNYFTRYAGVKRYIDRVIREAREKGYVTTLLNRRRYLPDLFSPNRTLRNFGERTAMNTPIQGSAADIIKLAMVNIYRELKEHGLAAKMLLQVHDELIFDAPAAEIDRLKELVKRCMENALVLDVPLTVDIKIGPNWYDVKGIKETM